MPERIQLRRVRGWRLPPNTVNVARPSRFGNPFAVELVGRERAIAAFRNLCQGMFSGPAFKDLTDEQFSAMYGRVVKWRGQFGGIDNLIAEISELRGKNLACWCRADQPCHADVLLELANP